MVGRTFLIVIALVALVFPASVPMTRASCPQLISPLSEWREQASVIFVGRAVEVSQIAMEPRPGDPEGLQLTEFATRFLVEERFKGDLGEHVTVFAARGWDDCIVKFDVGERYIVFAFNRSWSIGIGGPRGEIALRTEDSSPTARVSARPDAVAYLRRIAEGTTPSIVGTVYDRTPPSLSEMNSKTAIGWYGVSTRGGLRVVLSASEQSFETVADSDGAFVFDDIPAGMYSIRLDLPEGVRLEEQSQTAPFFNWSPDRQQRDRVEITSGETVARYFIVNGSALIAGRGIASSGVPLRDATACLVPAATAATFAIGNPLESIQRYVADDGRFEFESVPAGEYVIAFNTGRDDAHDDMGPAFFHPGVLEPDKATRFQVKNGMSIDAGEAKAPRNPSFRQVKVEVVDAKGVGHEATLTLTSERDGREFYFHTDAAGRTRLWLRPGLQFRIVATSSSDDERVGGTVEIPSEASRKPLRLVIP